MIGNTSGRKPASGNQWTDTSSQRIRKTQRPTRPTQRSRQVAASLVAASSQAQASRSHTSRFQKAQSHAQTARSRSGLAKRSTTHRRTLLKRKRSTAPKITETRTHWSRQGKIKVVKQSPVVLPELPAPKCLEDFLSAPPLEQQGRGVSASLAFKSLVLRSRVVEKLGVTASGEAEAGFQFVSFVNGRPVCRVQSPDVVDKSLGGYPIDIDGRDFCRQPRFSLAAEILREDAESEGSRAQVLDDEILSEGAESEGSAAQVELQSASVDDGASAESESGSEQLASFDNSHPVCSTPENMIPITPAEPAVYLMAPARKHAVCITPLAHYTGPTLRPRKPKNVRPGTPDKEPSPLRKRPRRQTPQRPNKAMIGSTSGRKPASGNQWTDTSSQRIRKTQRPTRPTQRSRQVAASLVAASSQAQASRSHTSRFQKAQSHAQTARSRSGLAKRSTTHRRTLLKRKRSTAPKITETRTHWSRQGKIKVVKQSPVVLPELPAPKCLEDFLSAPPLEQQGRGVSASLAFKSLVLRSRVVEKLGPSCSLEQGYKRVSQH